MRTRVAVVVAAVGLSVLWITAAVSARSTSLPPRAALVPNAVAFSDRLHGVLGTGWEGCANHAWHCRLQGTISLTSNGGKTWRVVRRTPRPVVRVAYFHDAYYVRLRNGVSYVADSAATSWHRTAKPISFMSSCPKNWLPGISSNFLDQNLTRRWSICVGEPGAGNEAKAVYRGREKVAYTPMTGGPSRGGISGYGYADGIAGTYGGFGIIWESRGTLYVTRDGGYHWRPLPKIARPEIDFGDWADAGIYPQGTAFVLLSIGGSEKARLIETTNAGRTWRVVHRWR